MQLPAHHLPSTRYTELAPTLQRPLVSLFSGAGLDILGAGSLNLTECRLLEQRLRLHAQRRTQAVLRQGLRAFSQAASMQAEAEDAATQMAASRQAAVRRACFAAWQEQAVASQAAAHQAARLFRSAPLHDWA